MLHGLGTIEDNGQGIHASPENENLISGVHDS